LASLLVDQGLETDKGGMSLAVVSAASGGTCTAVAWRTAQALAAQGLRVLLLDVDGGFPPPRAWMARVTEHLTWVEQDDGTVTLDEAHFPRVDHVRGVARSQPSRPRSSLYVCVDPPPVRSQKDLRALFRDLEDTFDMVVVNSPPFLPSAEASYLSSAAGTALVVTPDGGTVTDHEELARRLRLASVLPVGYVYCRPEDGFVGPAGPVNRILRALHVEPKAPPILPTPVEPQGTRLTPGRP
jgi:Mrp family chromosome partitioning ATPase